MNAAFWKEIIFERPIACLASSVSILVNLVADHIDGYWYGSDMSFYSKCDLSPFEGNPPRRIGGADYLLSLLAKTGQFESGVLLLFPCDKGEVLDRAYFTEDEEYRDIGDAILEIRFFDTNFYEIYGRSNDLREVVIKFSRILETREQIQ